MNSLLLKLSKLTKFYLFLCIFCFGLFSNASAQDSKGTDFWLMFPTQLSTPTLTLFITSEVNTSGVVSGASFANIPYTVAANTITSVNVPVSLQTHTSDVVDNKGIHVTALNEVTVYGLNRATSTTDAYSSLPIDALGTDYRVMTYQNTGVVNGTAFGIVGTINGTVVTITPSVTSGARVIGVPYNITLNQGEAYYFEHSQTTTGDLTGTLITSNQPIGVFGSHRCANVTAGCTACDHIVEMLPPTTSYGKKFGAVPLGGRDATGDQWKFLASQNGTIISINGVAQSPVLNAGQSLERNISTRSVIDANLPILAAQFAKGISCSGNITGDPFMTLVPSFEQYVLNYTMSTATGFTSHYINIVAPNAVVGSLTRNGTPVPAASYSPIGTTGFSTAVIPVAEGVHTLNAIAPFGATIYGWNNFDSYGYGGGQSFSPVASVSSIDLTPATGNASINANQCFQTFVRDQLNNPVQNIRVDYTVTGANPQTAFSFTNSSGISSFCYTGTTAGIDNIVANVGTLTDASAFTWTACTVNDQNVTASPTSVCTGSSSTITVVSSEPGVNYTLQLDPSNSFVAGPTASNGAPISFSTGNLTANTTYNVFAEKDKYSINLNGAQSGFAIPQAAALDVTDNFTIEGWIKPAGNAGFARMYNKDQSFALGISGNQTNITFTRHNAGDYSLPYTFTNGVWYHIAATYVGGTIELFVNGISQGTINSVPAIAVQNSGGHIGSDGGGNFNQFNGNIDNVRLWNSVRTQTQIAADQKEFITSTGNPSLVASWWIIEGAGNAKDYSANAINSNGLMGTWEVDAPNSTCNRILTDKPTVSINPTPDATATPSSQTICTGATITTIALTSTTTGTVYNWTRDNAGVTGIAASGSGNISGSLTNTTADPVTVTFTITPSYTNGGSTCTGTPTTATVVVNPTPNAVATPSAQTICSGATITTIALTGSTTGTVYDWTRDNAGVTGIAASGTGDIIGSLTNATAAPVTVTFTITPSYTNAGTTCTGTPITATVVVNPTPNAVATPSTQTICTGATITAIALTSSTTGTVYNWTRNNTSVTGIAASGSGDISGALTNTTNAPVVVTFTITPSYTNAGISCTGTSITATVTVNPTPQVNAITNQTLLCNQTPSAPVNFTTPTTGTVTYTWTNSTPSIGLPSSGTGNIPSFTVSNSSTVNTLTATIIVTPYITTNGVTCDGPTKSFTISVQPASNGSITGASNTQTCAGEGASVNVTLNGTPNFTSTFRIREILSTSPLVFATPTMTDPTISIISGSQAVSVPGSSLPNTTSVNKTYRIDFNSLVDGNGCNAFPQLGFVDITVNPLPIIAATRVGTGDVCPGNNIVFDVTETHNVGGKFNWIAKGATGDTLAFANGINYGAGAVNTNLGAACPYNKNVTFTFTPVGPGALFCLGAPFAAPVVNVRDLVAPTFTQPADITIYKDASCGEDSTIAITGDVTDEADNCSTGLQATFTDAGVQGSCQGSRIITRTWSLSDACGNTTTHIQTITVSDTLKPTFTRPADTTIYKNAGCIADSSVTATGDVTDEADNCSTGLQATFTDVAVNGPCQGSRIITRTWSLVDACGNAAANQVQTITVSDSTKPTFTRPADTTIYKNAGCIADSSVTATGDVTDEADNCSTGLQATFTDVAVNGPCQGSRIITRTWSLVDACGNAAATQIQTITVSDSTKPTFTRPADITIYKNAGCIADSSVTATGDVTDEADNCSTGLQATFTDVAVNGTCQGSRIITRTWSLVDACGNAAANQVQTITVADTLKPIIVTPAANMIVECDGLGNTAAYAAWLANHGGAVATDNCSTITWSTNCGSGTATYNSTIVSPIPVPDNNVTGITNSIVVSGASLINSANDLTLGLTVTNGHTWVGDLVIEVTSPSGITTIFDRPGVNPGVNSAGNSADFIGTYTFNPLTGTIIPETGGGTIAQGAYKPSDASGIAHNWTGLTFPLNPNGTWTIHLSDRAQADIGSLAAWNITANNTNVNCAFTDLCGATGVSTVTFIATDACGNASNTTATFTIQDTTKPTFTQPADITIYKDASCGEDSTIAITGDVTDEADNCSTGLQATFTDAGVQGSCQGSRIITRTWSLSDACGNTTTHIQTITVSDTLKPTFTRPADTTIYKNAGCIADSSVTATGDVTDEADNCSTGLQATFTDVAVNGPCQGSRIITRTWSLVDACGNAAANQVQTITVSDSTKPTFTRPADTTIYKNAGCIADSSVTATGDVTDEADNCSTGLQATFTDVAVNGPCQGSRIITRTWSLVDACGNAAATQIQTITVSDSTKPTFTRPADITIYKNAGCIADSSVTATGDVTDEADNCSTGLQATFTDVAVNGPCQGSRIITRTWSLVDACGNAAANQVQTITVSDSTKPTFTRPADTTIYKNAGCIADSSVTATGDVTNEADNCSTGLQATFTDVAVNGPCQGSRIITRTWSLVDACGNAAANQVQTITVSDSTKPTFTRPADITIYKNASCVADSSVTATGDVTDEADNCSTGLQATFTDVAVNGPCQGSRIITRTWSLVDACGNAAANQVQTITVSDSTKPTFTRPADTTIYKNAGCIADSSVTATGDVTDEADNCSTGLQATFTDVAVNGPCQGSRIITRTWSLVDACGNAAANQVQTITVSDSTKPTFTRPADTTIYKNAGCIADSSVTATGDVTDEADNCSTGLQATFTDVAVNGPCQGSRIITRTWSLVDACGNAAANQVQTITVSDSTKPTFTRPADTTIYKNAGCIADSSVTATGDVTNEADNCSTGLQATFTDVAVNGPCQGSRIITRTWSLVDACGNAAANQVQIITVRDTTRPTFTSAVGSLNRTLECSNTVGIAAAQALVPTASDNCSSILTPVKTAGAFTSGTGCAGAGTYVNTFVVTDDCGNTSFSFTQTITIIDTLGPVLIQPTDTLLNVGGGADCTVPMPDYRYRVAYTDCNAVSIVQLAPNNPGSLVIGYGGTRTIQFNVTDACGNTSTTSFELSIVDQIAPTAVCQPITVNLNAAGNATITPAMVNNGSSDNNCSPVTLAIDKSTFNCSNVGPNNVKLYVTDASGNVDSCTAVVTIVDVTAPVITCFADTIIKKGANCTNVMPNLTFRVTATDACGFNAGSVTQSPAPGTIIAAATNTQVVTLTVTDKNGNSSDCTFNVLFKDSTAPIITTCAPTQIGYTNANCMDTIPDFTSTVIATDNCTGTAGLIITQSPVVGTLVALGNTTVTITVRDTSNNSVTCTTTFTVLDNTAPIITSCGPAQTAFANSSCNATVPNFTSGVVATDNCSTTGALIITQSPVAGTVVTTGVTTITITVTDAANNATTCTNSFTVTDNINPTITVCAAPQTGFTSASCTSTVPNFTNTVTANDNCTLSGALIITQSPAVGATVGIGITTVTITVTDAANNSSTCTTTYTVLDNVAPTVICKPITVDLDAAGNATITAAMVNNGSFDNCSPVTLAINNASFTCSNVGNNNVILTVTDSTGNSSTCTAVVTVRDVTAPVITCFGDTTIAKGLNCTTTLPNFTGRVTKADACGFGANSVTQSIPAGTIIAASVNSRVITLTVTDRNNNSSTCTFTVFFTDQTAPVITNCTAPKTAFANASCSATVPDFVSAFTATDNCTGTATITKTQSPAAGSIVTTGVTTVTLTATDASGNATNCTTTFTVTDNTLPIIANCPSDIVLTSNGGNPMTCAQVATWTAPTASDNCGIATFTSNFNSGASFPVGTTTVTYTATDVNGNVATCSFTVNVTDNTLPLIANCPSNIVLTSNGGNPMACAQVATWTAPTASDNCGIATFTSNFNSGASFPVGTTTVTYTATDVNGNVSTCSFTVNVIDNTLPVIAGCPSNIVLTSNGGNPATCAQVATWTAPTASDNCGIGTFTSNFNSGASFPVGTTTVTYTATDVNGNVSTCSFTVNVTDNTKPVIAGCPSNIVLTSNGGNPATCAQVATWTAPTASDNCGIATFTSNFNSGASFPVGTTTVTYTATDVNGNVSTCSFTVNVTDNTKPVIAGCPSNIVLTSNGGNPATCAQVATWTAPTASDNCGIATFTSNFNSGASFPVGTTTVTYTATDVNGNVSTCSFTVNVTDNTKPVIAGCPLNIVLTSNGGNPATCAQVATWTAPTASDNCGIATFTSNFNSGASFPVGTTTVTYTATDVNGNVSTCSFTVNVTDNTKPVFTSCPPSITPAINAAGCVATVNTLDPSVTDNCTAANQINLNWTMTGAVSASSPATGINYVGSYTFPIGITTVTYTAMDVAGNTATCTYTVTVTNTLTGAISGTATVQQNSTTTSNITFTGNGGVKPYTFTYNVAANGGAAGANQTITTTGGNSITTVPQSSAVIGQYIYTLVSVTDANGCVGALPTDRKDTVTVVATLPAPDFTPAVDISQLSFATSASRDLVVYVSEVQNAASTGQVVVRLIRPSTFPVTFSTTSGTSNVGSLVANQNSDWSFSVVGNFITCTLKPGIVIPPLGTSIIGFRITRGTSTGSNTAGNIQSVISNGSGGDTKNNNNTSTLSVIAQ